MGHLGSVPSFKMDAFLAAIFEFTMDYTEISVSKVDFFFNAWHVNLDHAITKHFAALLELSYTIFFAQKVKQPGGKIHFRLKINAAVI